MTRSAGQHRPLLLIFLITGFVSATWTARLPATQERLGLPPSLLAFVVLSIEGGALLGLPLGGLLVNRYGSRCVLEVGMAGFPLLVWVLAIAPSLLLLCATAVVWAMINSIVDVAMNTAGVELGAQRGQSQLALLHAGHSAGLLVGGLGAVAAAALGGPLWMHFAVAACLALVAGCAAAARLPVHERRPTGRPRGRQIFGGDRRLMLLGAIAFCGFLVEGGASNWAAVDVRNHHDAPAPIAALTYTFFVVTLAITRYAGDRFADRFGRPRVVRTSGAIAAAGTVLAIAAPNTPSAIAGWATVGAGVALVAPTILAEAGESGAPPAGNRVHPAGPSAIAAVSTMGYLGSFTGPALIGAIVDHVGLTTAIGTLTLAALTTTALARRALTPGRPASNGANG